MSVTTLATCCCRFSHWTCLAPLIIRTRRASPAIEDRAASWLATMISRGRTHRYRNAQPGGVVGGGDPCLDRLAVASANPIHAQGSCFRFVNVRIWPAVRVVSGADGHIVRTEGMLH